MPHNKYGKIALCAAGGGSRGIVQWGMLKAWRDHGIPYDILFGTSVGALNGSLIHQNDWEIGEDLWLHIKNSQVFHLWPWDLVKPFTNASCIYDSTPLLKLCKKYINPTKIKSRPEPFVVNATEIWPLQKAVSYDLKDLSDDEIPIYIKCSANPPVYFAPMDFRGMKLIDGGEVNNFSILNAIAAGADTIVVMTPTVPTPKKPANILDMLNIITSVPEYEFLVNGMQFVDFINKYQAPFPELKHINDVLIIPPAPLDIDLLNFNYKQDPKSLISYGYDIAREILQKQLPC